MIQFKNLVLQPEGKVIPKNLKDEDLWQKTKALVKQEREILVELLNHLKEIDRRRLYLERGYSSLWAYMTTELKYSEAAAQRRIEAMRAIREFPVIENKIASGALSISNIAKAQTVLKRVKKNTGTVSETDKLRLFQNLEHKSQRETELLLATQFPEEVKIQESIRAIGHDKSELRLSISNELVRKLERVRNLISHQRPAASMAEVIELMADLVIQKKDLTKNESRESVKKSWEVSRPEAIEAVSTIKTPFQPPLRQRIAVPIRTRREVWQKAQSQCEFRDPKDPEKRCQSRYQLEIDHRKPVAFGGGNEIENLRLYCREHNRHEARQATLL